MFFGKKSPPTIFHITHWKAGSQWIYNIIKDLVPERIVPPKLGERQFFVDEIIPGGVYPTVYITKEQFLAKAVPDQSKMFVVLRDLRDTLVSSYYSIKYSHALLSTALGDMRSRLNQLDEEDGLIFVAENWLPACALIQSSWLKSDVEICWYERLVENDLDELERVMLRSLNMDISRKSLENAVEKNRFKSSYSVYDHNRKGCAGDWKNHFTPKVQRCFNNLYGGLISKYTPESFYASKSKKNEDVCRVLNEREVVDAYTHLSPLFPNIPPYLLWLSWECAAFRRFSISGHVLDYGCPDGRLANLILKDAQKITGVAPNELTQNTAELYGSYEGVMREEDFNCCAGASFDGVFTRASISQSDEPSVLLRRFHKSLKTNGFVLCSVLTPAFQAPTGVSELLRLHGFSAEAAAATDYYHRFHNVKEGRSINEWRVIAEAAGFSLETEIPIMPKISFLAFTLMDSLWHARKDESAGEAGFFLAAYLSANPEFADGFKSIVSGLFRMDYENIMPAGAILLLRRQ